MTSLVGDLLTGLDARRTAAPGDATAIDPRQRFRTYLARIGSGEHTSRGLSRQEARDALDLMLTGAATPAQIGAFLIAHRIRRPEPQELAGMIDLYRERGPHLHTGGRAVCFGMPYDGRNRTAPIYPLTALVLAAAGVPVVLTGADRMPVKYGVTPRELFSRLGLELGGLTLQQVQNGLDRHGLALVHQPDHFPLAGSLIPYREELGKRPPIASLELLWTPHQVTHLLVSGFVHPPTETRAWETLRLLGETDLVTVKGLEGGTDLPCSRACVTARVEGDQTRRTILHPRDHGCYAPDTLWREETWELQARQALQGRGELLRAVLWNAGTYLWFFAGLPDPESGIAQAHRLLEEGAAAEQLDRLIAWRQGLRSDGDDS